MGTSPTAILENTTTMPVHWYDIALHPDIAYYRTYNTAIELWAHNQCGLSRRTGARKRFAALHLDYMATLGDTIRPDSKLQEPTCQAYQR